MADVFQQIATAFLTKTPVKIDTLVLDCAISETHTAETEVTQHPVEEGAPVTDHARAMPEKVTIEGIVSDTPLSKTMRIRQVEALGIVFNTTADAEHVLGDPGYSAAAYGSLRFMRDTGALITVTTGLRTYENMIMTSLTVPRSKDTGGAFRFTCVFQHVRLVRNKLTAAKRTVAPAKVSTGKQTPKDATKAQKGGSMLYNGAHSELGQRFLGLLGITVPTGGQ